LDHASYDAMVFSKAEADYGLGLSRVDVTAEHVGPPDSLYKILQVSGPVKSGSSSLRRVTNVRFLRLLRDSRPGTSFVGAVNPPQTTARDLSLGLMGHYAGQLLLVVPPGM